MDAVGVDLGTLDRRVRRPRDRDLEVPDDTTQLRVQVLPLPDPQEVEELALAQAPEGAGRQSFLLFTQVVPEVEIGHEVRALVGEPPVRLVGCLLVLGRPFPRVLDRQRGGHDQHLGDAAETVRLEHHPCESGVHGEPHELAAEWGQASTATDPQGPQLLEEGDAVTHAAAVRRVDEGERRDVPQPDRGHLQDHGGEVGAQDLRVGELRPGLEVVLGVQPDADAVRDTAAPAGPLPRGGLRDRFDRQTLHLGAQAVPRDAGLPGVDDVPDAWDGQGGLRDVRGQHDTAPGVRGEHAVLLRRRQSRVQRKDLCRPERPGPHRVSQSVCGVADLALTRQEDEDVTGALALELADRVDDRGHLVAVGVGRRVPLRGVRVDDGAVAHLDGVRPTRHLDHGRVAEVLAEPG